MTNSSPIGTFLPSPSPISRLRLQAYASILADALKSGYGFTDASIVFGAALDGAALIPEPKFASLSP